mgnify:CR=1 FL=1
MGSYARSDYIADGRRSFTGFVDSLLRLVVLDWTVADRSTMQSAASRQMAPTTRASATMRLQIAVPMPSSRHGRTKLWKTIAAGAVARNEAFGRPGLSATSCGKDRVDTTAGTASR